MDDVASSVAGHIFGQFMDQVVTPVLIGVIIIGVAVYLFPFLAALFRRHKEKKSILAVNLLLGWTIVGWIWALLWAFGVGKKPTRRKRRSPPRKRKRRRS